MMSPTFSSGPPPARSAPRARAGNRLGADLGQQRDQRQQPFPERDPLPERHQIALGVAVDHAGLRIPPQRRRLALVWSRALRHRADQDRASATSAAAWTVLRVTGSRRVDVGGVLGPQDEVGPGVTARAGLASG